MHNANFTWKLFLFLAHPMSIDVVNNDLIWDILIHAQFFYKFKSNKPKSMFFIFFCQFNFSIVHVTSSFVLRIINSSPNKFFPLWIELRAHRIEIIIKSSSWELAKCIENDHVFTELWLKFLKRLLHYPSEFTFINVIPIDYFLLLKFFDGFLLLRNYKI